jgi:uncharacterized membrane protein (UPF0127 family)
MPWLVRDGKVLATLEVATSVRDRTRGLLGRDGIDGAILLRPAKSVHTLRMRFPIDVVFCDRELRVLRVTTLARNRVSRPVLKAHAVIESEAGTMGRWGVRVGDQLEIRGLDDDGVIDVRDGGSATTPGGGRPTTSRDGSGPNGSAGADDRRPTAGLADGGRADPVVPPPEPAPRPPADLVGDGDGGRP